VDLKTVSKTVPVRNVKGSGSNISKESGDQEKTTSAQVISGGKNGGGTVSRIRGARQGKNVGTFGTVSAKWEGDFTRVSCLTTESNEVHVKRVLLGFWGAGERPKSVSVRERNQTKRS